jgi:hypothetical protein
MEMIEKAPNLFQNWWSSCQDGWQVEHFANGGVGYDVILE